MNSTKSIAVKDIIKILEACKRLGVANFNSPNLSVAFCNTLQDNKIGEPLVSSPTVQEVTKIDTLARTKLKEELDNDTLDALLIEDPVEYDRLMRERLSEEGQ
jgi:hypothetical protein